MALVARVFRIDVSVCLRCRGPMRVLRAVNNPDEIAEALKDEPTFEVVPTNRPFGRPCFRRFGACGRPERGSDVQSYNSRSAFKS